MYRVCPVCYTVVPKVGSCPTCRSRQAPKGPTHYGHAWRIGPRRRQLTREPRCVYVAPDGERCTQRATDVDHIVPRADGGSDDPSNLQSLCHSHHASKTNAQNPRPKRSRRRRYVPRPEHAG